MAAVAVRERLRASAWLLGKYRAALA